MKKHLFVAVIILVYCSNVFAELNQRSKSRDLDAIEQDIFSQPDSEEFKNLFREYKRKQREMELEEANREFLGLNWGLGIAYTQITKPAIKKAQLVSNKVRITEDHKRAVALILETHYFFQTKSDLGIGLSSVQWGYGPFLGLRLTDSNGQEFGGYALGWMIGSKKRPDAGGSWNVGVAYFVDTKAKMLGNGIQEGQPLPDGETAIRYKEKDQSGWMFTVTTTF